MSTFHPKGTGPSYTHITPRRVPRRTESCVESVEWRFKVTGTWLYKAAESKGLAFQLYPFH